MGEPYSANEFELGEIVWIRKNNLSQCLNYFRIMNNEKDPSLSHLIGCVEEFHNAFRIPVRKAPTGELEEREYTLRFNLMKEENEEYLEAAQNGDIVEIADALGDMLYILCGTILKHGLQDKISEVFQEIQRSNMSKLDADGKPIYREDGKVLKSELYFKPDIKTILDKV
jgi:predicted HAD superfamily Cof-like phosphohydrolase